MLISSLLPATHWTATAPEFTVGGQRYRVRTLPLAYACEVDIAGSGVSVVVFHLPTGIIPRLQPHLTVYRGRDVVASEVRDTASVPSGLRPMVEQALRALTMMHDAITEIRREDMEAARAAGEARAEAARAARRRG